MWCRDVTTTKGTGVSLGGWLVQKSTIDLAFWLTHAPGASDEWTLCKTLGRRCGRGHQQKYLRRITEYAIRRYKMHVIIEATGHWGWFYNETAWAHSLNVMDEVLAFIGSSSSPGSFTLEPMKEPADRNRDDDLTMTVFGTPRRSLSVPLHSGLDVPLMLQSFKLPEYWAGGFSRGDYIVFDVHNYYFEGRNTTSENLPGFIVSDARTKSGDGTFPAFVGEWERNLKFGCYWTAKFEGNGTIDGEGSQKDYWSFERFIKAGFLL
ncbi:glycoside hydrolase superfamily [Aspergillus heterothallicus]